MPTEGEEGRGHIVAAARLQLVINANLELHHGPFCDAEKLLPNTAH